MLVAGAGALLRGLELGGSFIQLPNPSLCLLVITTAFQIAPNQPALSGLLLGTKGCWWNQRNAVAGLTGTLPPPQGHTLGKRRITLQVACSFIGILKNLLMLKQNVVNLVRGTGETRNFVS